MHSNSMTPRINLSFRGEIAGTVVCLCPHKRYPQRNSSFVNRRWAFGSSRMFWEESVYTFSIICSVMKVSHGKYLDDYLFVDNFMVMSNPLRCVT